MGYLTEYRQKLCSAEDAAAVVQSGHWVDLGYCAMAPESMDKALAKRLLLLQDVNIRGGVLLKKPAIFDIEEPGRHFTWYSTHTSAIERQAMAEGFVYYTPLRYSELPRYYRETYDVDVAVILAAPMDKFGYFNFGVSASHLEALCEKAKKVIVEVNENAPRCHGGTGHHIHISQVDMIIEGENPPIRELKPPVVTEIDKAVAKIIVERIPDGACLQIGIGGMPAAVGSLIAQSDLKDLGVHSEMYVDAFVDIAEAGKITGACKKIDRYRQVYTFAAGTKKMYDYLDDNPECMTAAVDYVNDIRVLASLDNFTSINAVNIDLFGQVSAETSGLKHISGAGGQLDFVLGAYLSKGGQSFICCASTYTNKDGVLVSRITPTLAEGSVVTDTRANVHYLVTEYGIANLKGLPTWQKAEAIISLAHPDFRDELVKQAAQMKIWKTSNKY